MDEQFNYVPQGSGFMRVGNYDAAWRSLATTGLPIAKSGYLFVYLSNETQNEKVFFDNLTVQHYTGPLTEETHYYPFGLPMGGISSRAAGRLENKRKYNGIEYENSFDLNMGETFFRTHDPQLGRWWQLDPKPNEMESLYAAMGNNPVSKADPLGDTTIFYNASGTVILRTTENDKNLGNVVTVIPDDKLESFNSYVSTIKSGDGNLSEVCSVQLFRSQGESYDTKGVFKFVDGNAKNYNQQTNYWQPTDGKGPLINEAAAAVEKKNGVWTVNPNKTDNTKGSPFASLKQSSPVSLHTHDNEGRKYFDKIYGKPMVVLSGPASVGADRSSNKAGTAIFEMTAGKNAVYFYNEKGVVFTVFRDAFNPKYFK